MDYLTVLSTCSVTLFSPPDQLPLPTHVPTSAPSPSSAPIDMPIQSLIYDDNLSFYFLLHHLLTSTLPPTARPTATVGAVKPDQAKRAEITVWEEIDKAKAFARALGTWFEAHERVTYPEMDELAMKFGLRMATNESRPAATPAAPVFIERAHPTHTQTHSQHTSPRLSPYDPHVDNQLARLSHLSVSSINSDALEVVAA